MTDWQPIEMAPKDGTIIIFFDLFRNEVKRGYFNVFWIAMDADKDDVHPICWRKDYAPPTKKKLEAIKAQHNKTCEYCEDDE